MKKVFLIVCLILISNAMCGNFADCLGDNSKDLEEISDNFKTGIITSEEFVSSLYQYTQKEDIFEKIRKCSTETVEKLGTSTVFGKIGLTLFYETNCTKDLAGVFILIDQLIGDVKEKDVKDAVFVAVGLFIVGKQSANDCYTAYQAIKNIWFSKHSNLRPLF